ncbi:hypothetical protein GUITHDRAFT_117220 [Guillardia theta CCMP2712]|uniref:Uncharacterized protein n=1 Tax=Guillardia theta (strain CCMP2712) TaxID=905079 RepID=L1IL89_GUITC|nr:hypothetical protein GUITHDRAFT_117220 [Guillardia theta CCMP2712]EKX36565.1 hypothetical protein GUITHDRAFT_117220 [Guillardia theta CCMP2712]|eukprot:XP_005823545.1 hypothetical protein GUITHDRAFT_117220 [Guillardia theta CCMP2712]
MQTVELCKQFSKSYNTTTHTYPGYIAPQRSYSGMYSPMISSPLHLNLSAMEAPAPQSPMTRIEVLSETFLINQDLQTDEFPSDSTNSTNSSATVTSSLSFTVHVEADLTNNEGADEQQNSTVSATEASRDPGAITREKACLFLNQISRLLNKREATPMDLCSMLDRSNHSLSGRRNSSDSSGLPECMICLENMQVAVVEVAHLKARMLS